MDGLWNEVADEVDLAAGSTITSATTAEATRSPNGRTFNGSAPPTTINPSVLDRQQEQYAQQKGRFNFDAVQRRAGSVTQV